LSSGAKKKKLEGSLCGFQRKRSVLLPVPSPKGVVKLHLKGKGDHSGKTVRCNEYDPYMSLENS